MNAKDHTGRKSELKMLTTKAVVNVPDVVLIGGVVTKSGHTHG